MCCFVACQDFAALGKKVKGCPYFASRAIASETAELVLCPYSYILDPTIRKAMDIDLKDAIVIIDEAHNVEDVSREASSKTFIHEDVKVAMSDLESMIEANVLVPEHSTMCQLLQKLSNDMDSMFARLSMMQSATEKQQITRAGTKILDLLDFMGVTAGSNMDALKSSMSRVAEEFNRTDDDVGGFKLMGKTMAVLESLFLIFDFVLESAHEYRLVSMLDEVVTSAFVPMRRGRGGGGGGGAFAAPHPVPQMTVVMHFWCLNPAVAFRLAAKDARSVILTSGTLSPVALLMNELDTQFPQQLEAMHVIDKSQIHACVVSHGPTMRAGFEPYQINTTYQVTGDIEYQDNIGLCLLHLIPSIPQGVLCFLPSYSLLDKLLTRWNVTGLLARLNACKRVCVEPRKTDQMGDVMRAYDEALQACATDLESLHHTRDSQYEVVDQKFSFGGDADSEAAGGFGGSSRGANRRRGDQAPSRTCVYDQVASQKGGLFFAVYRGKISEGIDFTDDKARAVICIGIPFANAMELQVCVCVCVCVMMQAAVVICVDCSCCQVQLFSISRLFHMFLLLLCYIVIFDSRGHRSN
jgi:Fanconi anemia group J protein